MGQNEGLASLEKEQHQKTRHRAIQESTTKRMKPAKNADSANRYQFRRHATGQSYFSISQPVTNAGLIYRGQKVLKNTTTPAALRSTWQCGGTGCLLPLLHYRVRPPHWSLDPTSSTRTQIRLLQHRVEEHPPTHFSVCSSREQPRLEPSPLPLGAPYM